MSQFPGDIGSVYLRRRHDPFAQYDPRRDMTPRGPLSPGKGRGPSGPGKGRGRSLPGKGGGPSRQPLDPLRNIGNVPPSLSNFNRALQEALRSGVDLDPSVPDPFAGEALRSGGIQPTAPPFALARSLASNVPRRDIVPQPAPLPSAPRGPSQNYRENLFRQPPPSFDPRGSGAIASGEVQLPGHQGRIGQRPGMPPGMLGGREPMAGGSYFDEDGNRVDFGGGNRGPVASIPTPVPMDPPYMPGFPEPGRGRGPSGPGKGRGPIMGSPGFPSPGKGRGPSGPGKGRGPIGSPGFPSPGKGRGPSGPGKGRGPSMPGKGRQNMPQPGGYYPQPPSSPSYPDAGIPPFSAPPSYNAPIMSPGYGQMQNTADRFAGYGIPQNMTDTFQFPHYQPYTPPAPLGQTGPAPYQPEPQPPGGPYRPPGSPADPVEPPREPLPASFQTPDDPHRPSGSPAMYQPMSPQQPPTFMQPNIGLPGRGGRGGFGFNHGGGFSGGFAGLGSEGFMQTRGPLSYSRRG